MCAARASRGFAWGGENLLVSRSETPNLGDVSISCLRCHATAGGRGTAEPVEGSPPLSITDGLYLGPDLSDDHPLGEIERDRRLLPDDGILTLRSRRVRRDVRTFRNRSPTETIECTTCHDPHSRTGPIPAPGEEAMLCGGCHDAGTYALGLHSSVACSDCHALHGARGSALLSEYEENRLCESCHGRGASLSPTTRDRDSRLLRLLVAPRGHVLSPGGRCADCHPAHGVSDSP
jgi:predicted CXXCH cytochrome family protein